MTPIPQPAEPERTSSLGQLTGLCAIGVVLQILAGFAVYWLVASSTEGWGGFGAGIAILCGYAFFALPLSVVLLAIVSWRVTRRVAIVLAVCSVSTIIANLGWMIAGAVVQDMNREGYRDTLRRMEKDLADPLH